MGFIVPGRWMRRNAETMSCDGRPTRAKALRQSTALSLATGPVVGVEFACGCSPARVSARRDQSRSSVQATAAPDRAEARRENQITPVGFINMSLPEND